MGTQEVGAAAGTHPTSVGRSTKAELLLLLPWLLVAVRSRRWKRPAREQKRKTDWSNGLRQEHLCNRLQKAMEHRTTLLLEANWKALRALRMSLDLPSIGVGLQEKNTKRTCRRNDLSQPTKVWIYGRPGSWSRDRSGRRFGWRPVLHLLGWRHRREPQSAPPAGRSEWHKQAGEPWATRRVGTGMAAGSPSVHAEWHAP